MCRYTAGANCQQALPAAHSLTLYSVLLLPEASSQPLNNETHIDRRSV